MVVPLADSSLPNGTFPDINPEGSYELIVYSPTEITSVQLIKKLVILTWTLQMILSLWTSKST